ncbi:hypothetical protein [Paeniglutamicibacter kerguelensis]|uniref:Uncharacterized protein n=1 Tax=Paeniglutamicibacter kerguelensis TaxID=254788 RepID=A0ABS4XCT0_9MICC|nr:hypothetical protein [Paeniglutamicibacter kerguelensis]MBP2386271.1 hypothetical protein [Paeniglutamicibacter kerguelensis]
MLFVLGLVLSLTYFSTTIYYRGSTIAALAAMLAAGLGVWFLTRQTERAISMPVALPSTCRW